MIDILIKIVQMKMITNAAAGIILFFVIKKFFEWQNERRLIRTVGKANRKVMSLLKPYVAAGQFPSRETYHSILATVARDYQIDNLDLYSVKYYCQEFIKEILENDYIIQNKKVEYTDILKEQITSYEATPSIWIPEVSEETFEKKQRVSRFNHQLNICTFLSSTVLMAVNFISGTNDLYESLAIFAVVLFLLILISDFGIKKGYYRDIPKLFRFLKKKSVRLKEDIEKKQEESARTRLTAENKLLADERDSLISELHDLKREMELDALKRELEQRDTEPPRSQPEVKVVKNTTDVA